MQLCFSPISKIAVHLMRSSSVTKHTNHHDVQHLAMQTCHWNVRNSSIQGHM